MSRVSGATWKASPSGSTGAAGFIVTLQDGSTVEFSSCFDAWPVPAGSHCAQEAMDPNLIQDGDSIFLRAHTGKRLTVQGDSVHAKGDHQGIFLRAHTGKRISVQGDNLHTKWGYMSWGEALTIERDDAIIGPLLAGDVVFLRAPTGKFITVEGGAVHAKWDHRGSWQQFTVERQR